jgi:hypothetical protein
MRELPVCKTSPPGHGQSIVILLLTDTRILLCVTDNTSKLALGIGLGLGFLLVFAALLFYYKYRTKKRKQTPGKISLLILLNCSGSTILIPFHFYWLMSGNQKEDALEDGFRIFSIEELRRATQNFHQKNVLGRGGFGQVYKVQVLLKVLCISPLNTQ